MHTAIACIRLTPPDKLTVPSAVFGEMLGEPPHRTAYLGNDAIEPRRRGQRVFDDREIDPERKQAIGEAGAKFSLSFICQ